MLRSATSPRRRRCRSPLSGSPRLRPPPRPFRRSHRRVLTGTLDFVVEAGRINVANDEVFARDPVNLVRLFHLADLILKQLGTTPGVTFKAPDETRTEIIRALTEEAKLAESIDGEVRKILGSYSRPMPEGSREWEVLYEKTREEVFRKRFRL